MDEKQLIEWYNKMIKEQNKAVDEHNRFTRIAFVVALSLLIGFMFAFEYFFK